MRVIELRDGMAIAERNATRVAVNALFLPNLRVGAFILAFQGCAVRELDEREATDIDRALTAVAAILAGDTNAHAQLSDLTDRERELPSYLLRHVGRG